MNSTRKTAIRHLEEESKNWVAMAQRELAEPSTREIGKVRLILIEDCVKLLSLLRQQE